MVKGHLTKRMARQAIRLGVPITVIIHHSKIVQRWLTTHPRVRVLHGARYSPHDNPVERVWARSRHGWPTTRP
jgi:hypothetical protein